MLDTQFRNVDTCKPNGCYVTIERVIEPDYTADPRDYLFQDPEYQPADQARLESFQSGEWSFVGVRAKANILIVLNGHGVVCELESPGLWGVESDCGEDYLAEIFDDECAELKGMISALANPTYEG